MSTVTEDLLAAADYIDEHGWAQNANQIGDAVCTSQAILVVTNGSSGERYTLARRQLLNYLGISSIVNFNDEQGRTKDEVLAALRAAAEVAS